MERSFRFICADLFTLVKRPGHSGDGYPTISLVFYVVVCVMDRRVHLAIQAKDEMDRFVVHTHPDAVLSASCSARDGTFLALP